MKLNKKMKLVNKDSKFDQYKKDYQDGTGRYAFPDLSRVDSKEQKEYEKTKKEYIQKINKLESNLMGYSKLYRDIYRKVDAIRTRIKRLENTSAKSIVPDLKNVLNSAFPGFDSEDLSSISVIGADEEEINAEYQAAIDNLEYCMRQILTEAGYSLPTIDTKGSSFLDLLNSLGNTNTSVSRSIKSDVIDAAFTEVKPEKKEIANILNEICELYQSPTARRFREGINKIKKELNEINASYAEYKDTALRIVWKTSIKLENFNSKKLVFTEENIIFGTSLDSMDDILALDEADNLKLISDVNRRKDMAAAATTAGKMSLAQKNSSDTTYNYVKNAALQREIQQKKDPLTNERIREDALETINNKKAENAEMSQDKNNNLQKAEDLKKSANKNIDRLQARKETLNQEKQKFNSAGNTAAATAMNSRISAIDKQIDRAENQKKVSLEPIEKKNDSLERNILQNRNDINKLNKDLKGNTAEEPSVKEIEQALKEGQLNLADYQARDTKKLQKEHSSENKEKYEDAVNSTAGNRKVMSATYTTMAYRNEDGAYVKAYVENQPAPNNEVYQKLISDPKSGVALKKIKVYLEKAFKGKSLKDTEATDLRVQKSYVSITYKNILSELNARYKK